ncbi:MAG: phosphotransferase [Actinomycetota bacterium]
MATTTDVPPRPADPRLATRELLDEGPAALASFLEARGWSLTDARPAQVVYRPGRACDVRYQTRASAPDGTSRLLTLCVETRRRHREPPAPPDAFDARYGLADPVERVGPYLVWAFPYDPSLPGLYDAAQGPAVRETLRAVGRRAVGVSVQPVRYRPRRRAVLRYTALTGDGHEILYGKVLRAEKATRVQEAAPGLSARLRRGHLLGRRAGLRLTLPLGNAPGDTLLFPRADGRSLRELLLVGASLPAPARVAALLDELPRLTPALESDGADGAPRPVHDPVRLAEHSRRLLTTIVPEAAGDVHRAVDAVLAAAATDAPPTRAVHGDLYEAQIFVADDFSLGLIDLDDLGPGDPAYDAANFCAHLVALGLSVPVAWRPLLAYRSLARRAFLERLDIAPAALGWREALASLLLASGPFRTLAPNWPAAVRHRVDLALRLLS